MVDSSLTSTRNREYRPADHKRYNYLVNHVHVHQGQIEILLQAALNVVLHEVLQSQTETGVDSVVFPGDGLGQTFVEHLNVPHGDLQRVPLRLHQLLGSLQILGLVVALVPPLLIDRCLVCPERFC